MTVIRVRERGAAGARTVVGPRYYGCSLLRAGAALKRAKSDGLHRRRARNCRGHVDRKWITARRLEH